MTTATVTDSMLERVRKLFAKAQSVAGTPEADAFNAKAYDLLAKYGIAEAEARQARHEGPAEIVCKEFDITGSYTMQQHLLLQVIAEACRCAGVRWNNNGIIVGKVYGTEPDLAQVTLLFSTLMPQMLAGAQKVTRYDRPSTTVARRNFMAGFTVTVRDRLTASEREAASTAEPATALVLVDDAKRATEALRASGKLRSIGGRRRYDADARSAGERAGSRVDLGQSRVAGQRALGR